MAEENFVQVFSPLLRSGIPSDELHVYLILTDYAGKKGYCWPSDRTIGGFLGRSNDTVQRILGRLEVRGLISRTKVEPTDENPTGRILTVHARVRQGVTQPRDKGHAKRPPPPPAPVRHESDGKTNNNRPGAANEPPAGISDEILSLAWAGLPEAEREMIETTVRDENPHLARYPKFVEALCLTTLLTQKSTNGKAKDH